MIHQNNGGGSSSSVWSWVRNRGRWFKAFLGIYFHRLYQVSYLGAQSALFTYWSGYMSLEVRRLWIDPKDPL